MQSIFGDVYDKKRLAPGQVTEARPDVLLHDCSTLGGNSGSVLVDLATGEAVGSALRGPLSRNQLRGAGVGRRRAPRTVAAAEAAGTASRAAALTIRFRRPGGCDADDPGWHAHRSGADRRGRAGRLRRTRGVRSGVCRHRRCRCQSSATRSDVLTFPWNGRQEAELKYQHFSVVMSRGRRLCIFSAGNIDGSRPRRFKRPSWRLDPRIPTSQQIRDECYGNEPLFARGHMTRREDPVWGEPDEAALGNSDSMHVTNTVPQMQPFNAGIWLALESYALDHARADHMRISVFTGPFLLADDPIRKGVLDSAFVLEGHRVRP